MHPWIKIDRETAFAYVINKGRLLVCRQTQPPEAGILVPGGLIESYETPSQAVLRIAREKTGLEGLILREYLGYAVIDLTRYGINETHRRHFFHLMLPGGTPITWLHTETQPEEGSPNARVFEFYWVSMPQQVPELITELDALVGGINLDLKPR